MPRYVRQWDEFSCGPIAILNALKWAGIKATVDRDYKKIRKLTRCEPPNGTKRHYLGKALGNNQIFFVRRLRRATVQAVENHLRDGGVVVLLYAHVERGRRDGHYTFLTDVTDTGETFTAVNRCSGETHSRIRRSTLVHDMRIRICDDNLRYPCAWLISKKT